MNTDPGSRLPLLNHLASDPRPDLQADHSLWETVLATLRQAATSPSSPPITLPASPPALAELLGLLHGLRCLGARLRVRHTRRGRSLFLDISPLALSGPDNGVCTSNPDPRAPDAALFRFDRDALRHLWLEPYRAVLQALFAAVLPLPAPVPPAPPSAPPAAPGPTPTQTSQPTPKGTAEPPDPHQPHAGSAE